MVGIAAVPAQASVLSCPTSNVCVYAEANFLTGGSYAWQKTSGFSAYADLAPGIHDRASSWINANNSQHMGIGEWVNGGQFIAQRLNAGWKDNNLSDIGFNDRADFVLQQ